MPISETEWEWGEAGEYHTADPLSSIEDTIKEDIIRFLRQGQSEAHDATEVATGIGVLPETVSESDGLLDVGKKLFSGTKEISRVRNTLNELVARGLVESKVIYEEDGETLYYRTPR